MVTEEESTMKPVRLMVTLRNNKLEESDAGPREMTLFPVTREMERDLGTIIDAISDIPYDQWEWLFALLLYYKECTLNSPGNEVRRALG